MRMRRWAIVAVLLFVVWPTGRPSAQQPASWHDPSPHTVQFVTVDENVKLEVLDWGGSGRPLVLLAGLGNTGHIFDEFAPKLASGYHVYGITRRGYGASSAPASGYSADRRGDDVLAVLDALKINRPVLVGHSIAGDELSSIGTRHPERVAGLIYIDAGYSNSFYDRSIGNVNIDSRELQKKLEQMRTASTPPEHKKLVEELVQQDLPGMERELQELLKLLQVEPAREVSPPAPSADDLANFPAYRAYLKRIRGVDFSEADLRQSHESKPNGGVGKRLDKSSIDEAIFAGEQKYTDLRLPVLAFFANPRDPVPFAYNTPTERAAFEALQTAEIEAQAKAFERGVPSARVVRVANANHYIFLSNETDVLREMRAFLAGLH
jgi:non-heme chloroperoxidase